MGVEAPATYEVTGEASAPLTGEEAPLETLVDEALRARPDVASKIAALRAQDLTNKATEGRYGPSHDVCPSNCCLPGTGAPSPWSAEG